MKKTFDVARAWRDADYYQSLTDAEKAAVPTSPAGLTAVDDEALQSVAGGCTCFCCGNDPN